MAVGDALGANYRLEEPVGSGASGQVWRATDLRTSGAVAAKLLRREHLDDAGLVGRFVAERALLLGLRNPRIVPVLDMVVEGERLAIVMEFMDGGSLRGLLQGAGTLPPAQALAITAEVMEGLAAAHADGVVHRDVKPDNVLLARTWESLEPGGVRLTDFGIARIVGEAPSKSTGLVGTPDYMAPELIGSGVASFAADVYGAGVVLYELLAGRTPFAGPGNAFTVAQRHLNAAVPRPEGLPEPLWELVGALLEKDPQHRPSAQDATRRLRRLAGDVQDLPALAVASTPDDFEPSLRQATVVKGMSASQEAPAPPAPAPSEPLPALGEGGSATMLRPLVAASPAAVTQETPPTPWKKFALWGGAALGVVLLVVAGVVWGPGIIASRQHSTADPGPAVQAQQTDRPTPTGLTVSRSATWDPKTRGVTVRITYAAQTAPLEGPFLEVVPPVSAGGTCPTAAWTPEVGQENLPSATGVSTPCAWAVTPAGLAAQEEEVVSFTAPLDLPAQDASTALRRWLEQEASATNAAVSDPQVKGTAYPVQRLKSIQVTAPASVKSQVTVPLTLIPVWPSGPDSVNPIYTSPFVGDPTSMLTAVAGGEQGVEFSDGCGGALKVSADSLVVSSVSIAEKCKVNARVGNLSDLESNTFSVTAR